MLFAPNGCLTIITLLYSEGPKSSSEAMSYVKCTIPLSLLDVSKNKQIIVKTNKLNSDFQLCTWGPCGPRIKNSLSEPCAQNFGCGCKIVLLSKSFLNSWHANSCLHKIFLNLAKVVFLNKELAKQEKKFIFLASFDKLFSNIIGFYSNFKTRLISLFEGLC